MLRRREDRRIRRVVGGGGPGLLELRGRPQEGRRDETGGPPSSAIPRATPCLFQCALSSNIVVCGGAGGKGDAIVPSVFARHLSKKRGRSDDEARVREEAALRRPCELRHLCKQTP